MVERSQTSLQIQNRMAAKNQDQGNEESMNEVVMNFTMVTHTLTTLNLSIESVELFSHVNMQEWIATYTTQK